MSCLRILPLAAGVACALLAPALLPAAEWSRFRGPNGSGVVEASAMPVEFGPQRAVRWSTSVPFGRSSPVLSERHVFLTAIEAGELLTLALDRATGHEAWRRGMRREHEADLHQATDSATPTPVTDGENVYAFFHEAGLVSYDAAGNLRWRASLGPFRNFYSVAASPILAGDLLVLLCDQARGSSFIVGFDKDTGEQRWRRERPSRAEAYATPLVLPGADGPRAILALGSKWIDAYDPATGETLWTFPGIGASPVASPILDGDLLLVAAPDQASSPLDPFASLLATHDSDGDGRLARAELEGVWMYDHFGWLDGDGDSWLSESDWSAIEREMASDHWGVYALRLGPQGGPPETVWNSRQSVPYIPTPLLYDSVVYTVKSNILSIAAVDSGELHTRTRLGAAGKVYASPVAAGGKIYIALLEGQVAVLEAGPEGKLLALNDLGDEIYATPALADGELYVRTKKTLYRFGREAEDGSENSRQPPAPASEPRDLEGRPLPQRSVK